MAMTQPALLAAYCVLSVVADSKCISAAELKDFLPWVFHWFIVLVFFLEVIIEVVRFLDVNVGSSMKRIFIFNIYAKQASWAGIFVNMCWKGFTFIEVEFTWKWNCGLVFYGAFYPFLPSILFFSWKIIRKVLRFSSCILSNKRIICSQLLMNNRWNSPNILWPDNVPHFDVKVPEFLFKKG